jgi:hypothetical protein
MLIYVTTSPNVGGCPLGAPVSLACGISCCNIDWMATDVVTSPQIRLLRLRKSVSWTWSLTVICCFAIPSCPTSLPKRSNIRVQLRVRLDVAWVTSTATNWWCQGASWEDHQLTAVTSAFRGWDCPNPETPSSHSERSMSENFPRRKPSGSGLLVFGATKSEVVVIPTVNRLIISSNMVYLPTSDDIDGKMPPSTVGFGGVSWAGKIIMRETIDMWYDEE